MISLVATKNLNAQLISDCLCLPIYGDGVLKARVFLRRHVSDTLVCQNECEYRWGMEERSSEFFNNENTAEIDHIFKFYPYPSVNSTMIYINQTGDYTISVVDLSGSLYYQQQITTGVELMTKEWPGGIYLVRLGDASGNQIGVQRLVVVH